jgi:hypothetical protein
MPGTAASASAVPAVIAAKRSVMEEAGRPAFSAAEGTNLASSVGTLLVRIATKTAVKMVPIADRPRKMIAVETSLVLSSTGLEKPVSLTKYRSEVGVVGIELDEETGCYLNNAGGKASEE